MKPETLLGLADQYLALARPAGRVHPDDATRHRVQWNYRRNLLRSFIRFWSAKGRPWPIPSAFALEWVASEADAQRPSRELHRIFAVRGFLKHLRGTEPRTQVPDNIFRRRPRRPPYLFSEKELVKLLEAPRRLRLCEPFHGLTLSTLIGLLASTGLRIGEAIRLKANETYLDTDPPHLFILETKFGKSRIVVLHPSVAAHLRVYAERRVHVLRSLSAETFFARRNGKPLRYDTTRTTFVRLLRYAGIKTGAGKPKATFHSLRHTFAVTRLALWHREGKNVAELLPHLSVYLGHLAPVDTYWYLTATPELLEAASARFENHQQERTLRP
ncbi:MAG: tyrosine-type recombinase/integrase [Candidatus Acidiferrales bacterium]